MGLERNLSVRNSRVPTKDCNCTTTCNVSTHRASRVSVYDSASRNRSSDCRELIELGIAWRGYDLQVRFFLNFMRGKEFVGGIGLI